MIKENVYKDEIEELRKERNLIRASNSFTIKTTEDILNTFNLDDGTSLVSFDELKSLNLKEVYDVNESISFVMTSKTDNKLVFTTYMMEGGTFGLQHHDCIEICKVIEGNLFESDRGFKVYTKGDTIIYAAFEKHKPYATVDSVYEVTFYKKL